MTNALFRANRRTCGTCAHWGLMTITSNTGTHVVNGPSAVPHEGTVIRTCGRDSRPGLVVNDIGWCRGSDTCSKWERC